MTVSISRRTILASSVAIVTTGLAAKAAAQDEREFQLNTSSDVAPTERDFQYGYKKTEAEWRAQLSEDDYGILREGKTEPKKSSPLWKESRAGSYRCKGCDLLVYSSDYKVKLNKGWVFFKHCEPDSVLTGIDLYTSYGSKKKKTVMEAHCRRCGSHFGHLLYVKGDILHCINGASLTFALA